MEEPIQADAVEVSVVVATRNRPESLRQCVESILAIERPAFELIVVDQSSPENDALAGIADPRLHVLRRETPGKAAAMNAGVHASRGGIIALTDDDCTVPGEWLQNAVRTMNREPAAAVIFGEVKAGPCDDADMFTPEFVPPAYRRLHGRLSQPRVQGMGANMIVRRSVFDELGGFEPAIGPGGVLRSGDDWEFAFRVLRAGHDLVHDPAVTIDHWGARSNSKGEVRRLLINNYFGVGGGLALHMHRGDWLASYFFLRQVADASVGVASNLIKRRQSGGRKLLALFEGFKAGWMYKPLPALDARKPGAAKVA